MTISHGPVMPVTVAPSEETENGFHEAFMPILIFALIALGAFGLIGLLLVLAVSLEHRKLDRHEPRQHTVA